MLLRTPKAAKSSSGRQGRIKLVLAYIIAPISNHLFPPGFELPSKSSRYKGPIRIVLAAMLAWEINSPRAPETHAFPSVCGESVGTESLQQPRAQAPKPTSSAGPWATQATFQHLWVCLSDIWCPFPGQNPDPR